MTHTLHRRAGGEQAINDYVILVMADRTITPDQQVRNEKYKQYLKIFYDNKAVNLGGMGIGHLYDTPAEKILHCAENIPMVHGVFDNQEDLVRALKDIKEADIGFSVNVTGLNEDIKGCIREAGLSRHSVNYSMGIWGNTSKLPAEKYLELSTMCGHALVSFNLIDKYIDEIKSGKISIEQAACELAKPCVCGVFNGEKAKVLLQKFM